MHKLNYYFIDKLDKHPIKNLSKNIAIIYRNYKQKYDEQDILSMKKFCLATNRKFYLANNFRLVEKLRLDGAYIPSFNKSITVKRLKLQNFTLLGSAHNLKEINQKKKQFLGIIRFNILSKKFDQNTVALGGINEKNIKIIKNIKKCSFASISYIKNTIK